MWHLCVQSLPFVLKFISIFFVCKVFSLILSSSLNFNRKNKFSVAALMQQQYHTYNKNNLHWEEENPICCCTSFVHAKVLFRTKADIEKRVFCCCKSGCWCWCLSSCVFYLSHSLMNVMDISKFLARKLLKNYCW